ncbi:MAG: hypothetical protein FWF60_09055, partial [Oscillospiraceae bacterium]|nr:hypothetical protein [Oscillospiraceae bacterium]
MKSIDNMAGNAAAGNLLSARDKQKFKYEILSLSGALVCLAAGLLYARLFPGQEIVRALITLAGIFVIGVPVVITAARGLLARDMQSAMEILVSIAMIVSVLDGQFTLAILIPVILTFVHFLEEKSIMGGRDAIEGLKRMQAETAVLLRDGEETEVGARDGELRQPRHGAHPAGQRIPLRRDDRRRCAMNAKQFEAFTQILKQTMKY